MNDFLFAIAIVVGFVVMFIVMGLVTIFLVAYGMRIFSKVVKEIMEDENYP